jgi:pimeloyl-ACP methyl ester carboxylesterase
MCFDAGIRVDGRDVALNRAGLAGAYPHAGESVVVFLHGLCETEAYWRRRSVPRGTDETGHPSYGDRLAAEHGWTPVYIRYNSGLGVAENGAAISALLGRLVASWPLPVRRIALVGHSMGGLVARAATAVAGGESWTGRVTDVVCLGTPHLGSPVARVAERGRVAFGRIPETAGVSRVLAARSIGIEDLRDGLPEAGNLPHASYRLVAATLTRSPRHPVALAIGDLLVQPRSALGTPRRGAELFPGADIVHVPSADHFDLLNHDDVYAALSGWLAGPRPSERTP